MGIRFLCPNGHKLNVKSFLAGKRAICPDCGAKVLVPIADDQGGHSQIESVPSFATIGRPVTIAPSDTASPSVIISTAGIESVAATPTALEPRQSASTLPESIVAATTIPPTPPVHTESSPAAPVDLIRLRARRLQVRIALALLIIVIVLASILVLVLSRDLVPPVETQETKKAATASIVEPGSPSINPTKPQ